jgi:hypothetical protein
MCKEDFYELEKVIKDHKERQGYDMEHHYKYASWSNVSPINLELWLFVMLRLLSGAMYLDMVWYEVSLSSILSLFCQTICEIDEALDNTRFPMDSIGIMQMVDNWAGKRKDRHGFAKNLGTALAKDGFVIEIRKPTVKELNEKKCLASIIEKDLGDYLHRWDAMLM